jgi:aspartokinase-like uncharacterized kinase
MNPEAVIKVGGSLYDLPDLGPRLLGWLDTLGTARLLLIPGGGATAEVVRTLHRRHGLSEELCHWLALRALSLNAYFLAGLLGRAAVVEDPAECPPAWATHRRAVLDLHAFARADEVRPGRLPHTWAVTSDAMAARVAAVTGARRLILLKSITIPEAMSWEEAGRLGYLDEAVAGVIHAAPGLEVRAVNLRADTP